MKIGNYVICRKDKRHIPYSITNRDMYLGKILSYNECYSEGLEIEIILHQNKGHIGSRYAVCDKYFEEIDINKLNKYIK